MFYQASSQVNSTIKSISSFLESEGFKEMKQEPEYNKANRNVFYVVSEQKDYIIIKFHDGYELGLGLEWELKKAPTRKELYSYKLRVREHDERYSSYFYSDESFDGQRSLVSRLLSDLEEAMKMKKEDWEWMEV